MVKQIVIDDNGVVLQCSIGGIIKGGIDVEDIPDEVMVYPKRYIYADGAFISNPDYVAPDTEISVEEKLEQLMAQSEYFDSAIAEIMLNLD